MMLKVLIRYQELNWKKQKKRRKKNIPMVDLEDRHEGCLDG